MVDIHMRVREACSFESDGNWT